VCHVQHDGLPEPLTLRLGKEGTWAQSLLSGKEGALLETLSRVWAESWGGGSGVLIFPSTPEPPPQPTIPIMVIVVDMVFLELWWWLL
jgi:hypothetical protein